MILMWDNRGTVSRRNQLWDSDKTSARIKPSRAEPNEQEATRESRRQSPGAGVLLNNRVLRWSLDERSTGASRAVLRASSEVYEPVAAAFKTTFTSGPAGPASLDGEFSFSKFFFFFAWTRDSITGDDDVSGSSFSSVLAALTSKSAAF